jgi:ABC-type transport system involved in cytochrome bd biosynthesis fused ATPase/permease subunit
MTDCPARQATVPFCYPARMLTAAITAAVAAVLSLFGIKPGAYLAVVALVIKLIIVAVGLYFGAKLARRRADAAPAANPVEPPRPPDQR